MRKWLTALSEIDRDCVDQYEYLLGRELTGHAEYTKIDRQVDEMILEWDTRESFFEAYPALKKYASGHVLDLLKGKESTFVNRYDGMLSVCPKPGYRGYYPVTSREEWEALPDLYKVMEWEPVKDPRNANQLCAVKAVIFDVVHLQPYGINAKVSVHPEDVQQILFCSFENPDCHLYSVCGVELEGGSRLPAKWLQDSVTGAFGIYTGDTCIGRQGGFGGYIPEHVQKIEDGTFRFDFQYGSGKKVHYALHNPFPENARKPSLNDRVARASKQGPEIHHSAPEKGKTSAPEL